MTLIDEMRKAIQAVKDIGTPQTEYRIHPDDYAEMRSQVNVISSAELTRLDGMKLILDQDAPRLPRRVGT